VASGVHNVIAVFTHTAGTDFTDSQGQVSQTVNAVTTTVLTSSANPSLFGSAVTLTATTTNNSGAAAPTGKIEIFDGATDLGQAPFSGTSGNSTSWKLTTSGLAVGVHNLKAVFTPTGAFVGSQGTLTQTVAANVLPAILQTDGSLFLGTGPGTLISPAGTIMAASAAMDGSGFEHVFAIVKGFDAAGASNLWEYSNGPTPGWGSGPISVGHFQSISAAMNSAGNPVVFAILANAPDFNPVFQKTLWEFGSQFGGWAELSPGKFNAISAVTDAKGNDVVFAITADTHLWEHSPAIPNGWVQLSNGSFTAVSAGVDGAGQAEVFGIILGGSLWVNDPPPGVQPALNQFWTQLSPVGANSPSSVLAITSSAARDEVFAVDGNHALWQHTLAGWTLIDSTNSWAQLSSTQDQNGVDQVFGTLSNASLLEYSPALPGNHIQTLLSGGVANTSTPRRLGF
jgi:hypothetical protein